MYSYSYSHSFTYLYLYLFLLLTWALRLTIWRGCPGAHYTFWCDLIRRRRRFSRRNLFNSKSVYILFMSLGWHHRLRLSVHPCVWLHILFASVIFSHSLKSHSRLSLNLHTKKVKKKTKITHHTLSGIIIQVCRPQKELKDAPASWKWKPVWHWTGKSFVSSEHQCHFHYIVFIYRIHCFASFEICFLWYATKRWRSHYLNACEYCEFCSRE